MKAALSLDLDNKWSYMKTHGDPAWQSFPSYLNLLVPRILDTLDELGVKITFFLVGQDAEQEQHHEIFGEIARRGHEIGNHSHYHEPWMHRRNDAAIDEEFARSEESIERATGQRTRGFRGPGFTRSTSILETLVRRGYLYDGSSLPTFIGPLARAFYFRSVKLGQDEMKDRDDLFGRFSDGWRPNRPHEITLSNGSITEIPVTTMPVLRVPIHISYVQYIATRSPAAALAYFRTAMQLCRITRTPPSILLHPLDFLGGAECEELAFFPAMSLDPGVKRHVLLESLRTMASVFDVVPMKETLDRPSPALGEEYREKLLTG